MGYILGLYYRDGGKENGSYYIIFFFEWWLLLVVTDLSDHAFGSFRSVCREF